MVSIIVPVYNTEAYLDKCINSIVEQTYKDIEIILVDDCSTDNSLNICKKWNEKDDRIRLFSLEKNSGPSEARNKGMREARGEYVTFVDSDDWIEKTCIEIALNAAYESGADLVIWDAVNIYGDTQVREKFFNGNRRLFQDDEIKRLEDMFFECYNETEYTSTGLGRIYSRLYKRDVLCGIKYQEHLIIGEDKCFALQVIHKSKRVLYIDGGYYFRVNRYDSLSNRADLEFADKMLQYVNWMMTYCMEEKISSEKVLNNFMYSIFKTVAAHYMWPNKYDYRKVVKRNLNHFLDNLCVPIKWKEVTCDDKIKIMLLKNGWYWVIRIYFRYSNMAKSR